MNILIIFIVLNVLNVIIQTVKSICTIKCGKLMASFVNALAYGLYTVVLVYMSCDLTTWTKALIVALCNLIGVYVVKLFEEKMRKDKLWKIELTIKPNYAEPFTADLEKFGIPYTLVTTANQRYTIVNTFCAKQKDSAFVKSLAERYNAKYFVSETKCL